MTTWSRVTSNTCQLRKGLNTSIHSDQESWLTTFQCEKGRDPDARLLPTTHRGAFDQKIAGFVTEICAEPPAFESFWPLSATRCLPLLACVCSSMPPGASLSHTSNSLSLRKWTSDGTQNAAPLSWMMDPGGLAIAGSAGNLSGNHVVSLEHKLRSKSLFFLGVPRSHSPTFHYASGSCVCSLECHELSSH